MGDLKREKEILNILIVDIIPNRFQPRLVFDDESMRELANSIFEHGIIQPLVVRRVADKYEIIAGERRYKAATMAGLQTVPVIVVELNDGESAEVALIENIQRKDLSAVEEAKSYQKVLEMGQLTQEALAKRMGKSQSAVANKIRLLSLPFEVQEALNNNDISERHARSLLSLNSPADQINMMNKVIAERLTVRKTDQAISDLLGQANPNPNFNDDLVEKLDFMDTNLNDDSTPESNNFIPAPTPVTPDFQEFQPPEPVFEFPAPTMNPASSSIPDLPTSYPTFETQTSSIPDLPSEQQLGGMGISAINNDAMLKPDFTPEISNFSEVAPVLEAQDYKNEINEIRDLVKRFNTAGVTADIEEYDFEQFYQLNIKINKNQP